MAFQQNTMADSFESSHISGNPFAKMYQLSEPSTNSTGISCSIGAFTLLKIFLAKEMNRVI